MKVCLWGLFVLAMPPPISAWAVDGPRIESPPICAPETVELFSCGLKSGNSAALCLAKNDLAVQFTFVVSDGQPKSYPLHDIKQLLGPASAGTDTIVRGESSEGSIILYLGTNTAEPMGSAVELSANGVRHYEFCIDSTVRHPVSVWSAPSSEWKTGAHIFDLIPMGVAKSFGLTIQAEGDLARTWPRERR
jgi:hypothetical protein